MSKILSPARIDAFHHDGLVPPLRAIPTERALYYRRRLEPFDATYPDPRINLDQKTHMTCPCVDEMIREPGTLDATEDLIAPATIELDPGNFVAHKSTHRH